MAARWRVLITARSFADAGAEPSARLEHAGVELLYPPVASPLTDDMLAEFLGDVDGIIAGVDRIGPLSLARGYPRLKVIARNGVGVDGIDLATATRLGIVVTNAPGTNTEAVADLVFGLMIGLARHLPELDRAVREGCWTRVLGRELHRSTLGLIGLGQVGRAVARRAAGFEMRLLATDPAVSEPVARQLGVTLTSLDAVLAEADFVSVHVPRTPHTIHLVGEAQLRRMNPSAYLINTARGGIVDEAALARALHEGWIAGAACDVFEREPPVGSPLLGAPRLILTPHIGAHTREAVARGATPSNVVNPEVRPAG